MHPARTALTLVLIFLFLAGCGSQNEVPASSPTSLTAASTLHESRAEAHDIDGLMGLAAGAGLTCSDTRRTLGATHDVLVCDNNLLLAYFRNTGGLQGYVAGYQDKGNSVIQGKDWFIAGPPDRVEPLLTYLAP